MESDGYTNQMWPICQCPTKSFLKNGLQIQSSDESFERPENGGVATVVWLFQ